MNKSVYKNKTDGLWHNGSFYPDSTHALQPMILWSCLFVYIPIIFNNFE